MCPWLQKSLGLVCFFLNEEAEEKVNCRSQLPADLLPQYFVGLEFNVCFLARKWIQWKAVAKTALWSKCCVISIAIVISTTLPDLRLETKWAWGKDEVGSYFYWNSECLIHLPREKCPPVDIPIVEVIVDSAVTIKELFSVERKQLFQHHGSCTGKASNPPTLLAHSCWGINVCKLHFVYSLTHLNFSDF